jgi:hypothetical protein
MEKNYYTSPKSNWITRMLWKAAGADQYILNKATYSDHVKYATLGGIVCSTGFMAAMAGGYAFYVIFSPKVSAISSSVDGTLNSTTDIPTVLMSIIFAIIWGLIIFNIDRFIVASTGKGDGTEAITWGEFTGAIPRIIMGIIIAITISKPVELRMFETEINVKLYQKQQELYLETKKIAENQIQPEIDRVDAEIRELKSEIQTAKEEFVIAENIYLCEMDGSCGSNTRGDGPQTAAKKVRADNLKEDWEDLKLKNGDKIKILESQIVTFQNDKLKRFEKAEASANSLNGLLERINIAHEIAGFWVTLFITLLFMAIELTPIFFKMMLIKSPYDFMNDNIKALIKAERGIEIKYDFYKDKEGVQRDLVINHQSENLIREKVKLLQTQADLNEIVLDEWKSKETTNIKKDPSKYIDS